MRPGIMTQQVALYRKDKAGTSSPEGWVQIDNLRRAYIEPISDNDALKEAAAYEMNVTHRAYVDAADDFKPDGHGSRVLKRISDDQNFFILRVVGAGPVGRTGTQRYMRLSLTAIEPAVV